MHSVPGTEGSSENNASKAPQTFFFFFRSSNCLLIHGSQEKPQCFMSTEEPSSSGLGTVDWRVSGWTKRSLRNIRANFTPVQFRWQHISDPGSTAQSKILCWRPVHRLGYDSFPPKLKRCKVGIILSFRCPGFKGALSIPLTCITIERYGTLIGANQRSFPLLGGAPL